MSVTISGSAGLSFNDGSQLAGQLGIFNRVIDGGFIINQRGYVTNTALSAGAYGHDRWKAGASGCTYTFTQGSLGVNTTITITANSLQQVIEGCNMPEGGTYTLSWSGTAQARINGGSYSASPLTTTGITAGANCTIEFNTGTVSAVQMESGSYPSTFAFRPYGTELALCQRYALYYGTNTGGYTMTFGMGFSNGGNQAWRIVFPNPVPMRATPTATFTNIQTWNSNGGAQTLSSVNAVYQLNGFVGVDVNAGGTVATGGYPVALQTNGSGGASYFLLSSEL